MLRLSYFKVFIFLITILTTFSSIAKTEIDSYIEDTDKHQIYVTIDRIIILNEGIYVDLEHGGLVPVKNVTWLQDGLCLIVLYRDPDCGHAVYCPNCGGCNPRNRCPSRCKCPPRRY